MQEIYDYLRSGLMFSKNTCRFFKIDWRTSGLLSFKNRSTTSIRSVLVIVGPNILESSCSEQARVFFVDTSYDWVNLR